MLVESHNTSVKETNLIETIKIISLENGTLKGQIDELREIREIREIQLQHTDNGTQVRFLLSSETSINIISIKSFKVS